MKLIFASSPSHDVLKEYIFLGTLCETWDLIEIRFELSGDGSYNSPTYNRIVTERMTHLLEIIRQSRDEVVVFADVDIQWFRPCQAALLNELEGKDIVFQLEFIGSNLVNCGFFAIRCNSRTIALFEQVVAATRQGWNEQVFVNHLVKGGQMPCRHGLLPRVFLNDNLDGPHAPPDEELLLYHSVDTPATHGKNGLQIKLERHLAMRTRVLGTRNLFRGVCEPPPPADNCQPAVIRSSPGPLALNGRPHSYLLQFGALPSLPQPPFQNLILHPNGRVYGGVSRFGCRSWRLADHQLLLVDHRGRTRMALDPAEGEAWIRRKPGHRMASASSASDVTSPRTEFRIVPQPEFSMDKMHFEIVVAKYKEDVAWTDAYAANVTIYSKNNDEDEGKYPTLSNMGFEGGTYLHHIIQNYDRLADRTLFLQGDPFLHPLLPIPEYAAGAAPFTAAQPADSGTDWSPHWTSPGQMIDQLVMREFLRMLECDPDVANFRWTQGAQFATTRAQIQKRPRAYYERLFDLTQWEWTEIAGRRFDNHHVAWMLEFFWRNVFLVEPCRAGIVTNGN